MARKKEMPAGIREEFEQGAHVPETEPGAATKSLAEAEIAPEAIALFNRVVDAEPSRAARSRRKKPAGSPAGKAAAQGSRGLPGKGAKMAKGKRAGAASGGAPRGKPRNLKAQQGVGPATDKREMIRERILMHPNGLASEIAASLALDGVKVTSVQVEEVMNELKSPPA